MYVMSFRVFKDACLNKLARKEAPSPQVKLQKPRSTKLSLEAECSTFSKRQGGPKGMGPERPKQALEAREPEKTP